LARQQETQHKIRLHAGEHRTTTEREREEERGEEGEKTEQQKRARQRRNNNNNNNIVVPKETEISGVCFAFAMKQHQEHHYHCDHKHV